MPVDLAAMAPDERPDFLAFTGHKVTGPTGIGVLWGRAELLEQLPPFLGGGEMIATVTMERSTYAGIPHKFEAGTPPIVEAVGLGAAVDYLAAVGMDEVRAHEEAITGYALEGLATVSRASPCSGRQTAEPARRRGRLRARRRAPARRQPGARLARRRRARRAPLRQAGAQAVRRAELDPHVVVPLHDAGRDRRAGRGAGVHQDATSRWAEHEDLDALYQEIILDHYKHPHHAGLREPYEAEVHHVNPTCGDEVTLRVHLSGSGAERGGRGRVVRRRGLLDQPGRRLGDGRPGDRQHRRRTRRRARGVPAP